MADTSTTGRVPRSAMLYDRLATYCYARARQACYTAASGVVAARRYNRWDKRAHKFGKLRDTLLGHQFSPMVSL